MLRDGKDPVADKRARKAAQAVQDAKTTVTFADAGEAYIVAHAPRWSDQRPQSSGAQSLKNYAYPIIGHLPVDRIDTDLVMKVLEPIWHEITETASRVRRRIESILERERVLGHRAGPNSAVWRGHLQHALAPKSAMREGRNAHHPALQYVQVSEFVAAPGGAPWCSGQNA